MTKKKQAEKKDEFVHPLTEMENEILQLEADLLADRDGELSLTDRLAQRRFNFLKEALKDMTRFIIWKLDGEPKK